MLIGAKVEQNGAVKSMPLDDVDWLQLLYGQDGRPIPDAAKLVASVDWMFRCVTLISGATAAIPYTISPINGDPIHDSDKDDTMPPGLERYDNLEDVLAKVSAAYPLFGRAYALKQKTRGRDMGIRYLAPSTIRPEINAAGLAGFERIAANGVRMRLPVDDVLYWWYPDAEIELGEPLAYPGAAAAQAAGVLSNMDVFLAAYFRRGMIKATLFVTKGIITEPERDRVKDWWKRMTGGLRNAFSTEVINGDQASVMQIGDGIGELGNAALTQEKREAISTAFGVPHSLVMSNAANYATAQQDVLSLYQNTVIPQAKELARQLNRQLFAPMGYWFRFEYGRIEAMQKSELEKAEMVQRLVGGSVLTVNEGRALLGYEPVPGGDELKTLQPQPPQLAAVQAAPELPMPAEEPPPMPDMKAQELARLGRFVKNHTYLERPFHSDVLTPDEISAAILAEQWRGYP